MTCPRCGTENAPGNRFCMKCGTDLLAAGADTGGGAGMAQSGYAVDPGQAQSGYADDRPFAPGEHQGTYTAGPYAATPEAQGSPGHAPPRQGYGLPQQGYGPQGTYAPPGSSYGMVPQGELAGAGKRFLAWLIDLVLYLVVLGILNAIKLGVVASLLYLVYFAYFWSTSGQTLGAQALGIKVVRADGQPLTFGTGVLRVVGYIVSAIPFYVGFLWILWDAKKQGWLDKIAGTLVVQARPQ